MQGGGGHIARKRFGQNFLVDHGVIDEIVRAIAPQPGQHLVEIGPGLGALTNPVVERSEKLTVIELDRDLAARLRKRAELNVIESDVLKVDFGALAQEAGQKLRLIGNLPYNISSPILFHLLPWADQVVDQHFMLQKEVVDRMVATPGNKDYSRLSVMLQWRYRMECVVDVPPGSFDPPPKVDSAVVRMIPLATPPEVDLPEFAKMVAVAFSQRRKILRHTLGAWMAEHGIEADFDLQRRAEEVPVADYLALAALKKAKTPQPEPCECTLCASRSAPLRCRHAPGRRASLHCHPCRSISLAAPCATACWAARAATVTGWWWAARPTPWWRPASARWAKTSRCSCTPTPRTSTPWRAPNASTATVTTASRSTPPRTSHWRTTWSAAT